jgi:hypothetical protein
MVKIGSSEDRRWDGHGSFRALQGFSNWRRFAGYRESREEEVRSEPSGAAASATWAPLPTALKPSYPI